MTIRTLSWSQSGLAANEILHTPAGSSRPQQRMTTYFVSRHPGAIDWAQRAGIVFEVHIPHLNPASVGPNDTVIGTLPVQSVAQVCAQGARYLHLTFDMPPDKRGCELSADDLTTLGARLRAFTAHAA